MTRVKNVFCDLLYLIGLAETAEATVKLWEQNLEQQAEVQKTSGTQNPI